MGKTSKRLRNFEMPILFYFFPKKSGSGRKTEGLFLLVKKKDFIQKQTNVSGMSSADWLVKFDEILKLEILNIT